MLAVLVALAAGRLAAQDVRPGRDTVLPQRPLGVLRPGDVLRVVVFGEQAYSCDCPIDARGAVQIPGAGTLLVAGLSPIDVGERIREQLERRGGIKDPQVSVEARIRVSVFGEVRTPGLQLVEPGSTLIRLLATSGGPSDRADLKRTRVVRGDTVYVVDLQAAFEGSAVAKVVVFSNDVVYVPRRTGLTRENLTLIVSSATAILTFITLVTTLRRQ